MMANRLDQEFIQSQKKDWRRCAELHRIAGRIQEDMRIARRRRGDATEHDSGDMKPVRLFHA